MADGFDRLVAVMDRLRSPGGCEWDVAQPHASLAPRALEEAHSLVDAIETGTRADLREEPADALLQVVCRARVAQQDPDEPFGLDDVAVGRPVTPTGLGQTSPSGLPRASLDSQEAHPSQAKEHHGQH